MKQISKGNTALVAGIVVLAIVIIGLFFYSSKVTAPTSDVGPSPLPTVSTSPTVSSNPSVSVTPSVTSSVKLYYIALNTPGTMPVGCGDGAVAVTTQITPTQAPLKAALTALFAQKNKDVGQYYNALYGSNLSVDSVTIVGGKATVKISGTTSLGGVCDAPRFIAQIKQTVMQFSTVTSADITINGKKLESIGSEQ